MGSLRLRRPARELTTKELETLAESVVDMDHKRLKKSYNAAKIIASVYDPQTGLPLFTRADIKQISEWPVTMTKDICAEIEKLNDIVKADVDDAKND